MNFSSLPHLLIGTNRIATVHRRLAALYADALPLRILDSPVPMPPVIEAIQWHRYRELDPARAWLYAHLRAVVSEWASTARNELVADPAMGPEH